MFMLTRYPTRAWRGTGLTLERMDIHLVQALRQVSTNPTGHDNLANLQNAFESLFMQAPMVRPQPGQNACQ